MANFLNIKEASKQALAENNSAFNVHDNLKHLTLAELQEVSKKDQLPWHTMTINLTGDLNVGTIIRTSHLLGATSVIVVGRTKIDRRSMVGAENYITVEKYRTVNEQFDLKIEEIADIFEKKKLTPIFCEAGGIALPKANWKTRIEAINLRGYQPCLVMGNETGGIPDDLLYLSTVLANSFIISVPMKGVIRSLNVAAAHSIIAGHMCATMGWM